jgi:hypothetical protein
VLRPAFVRDLHAVHHAVAVAVDRLRAVDVGIRPDRLANQAFDTEVGQLQIHQHRVERQVQRVAGAEDGGLPANAESELDGIVRLSQSQRFADVDVVVGLVRSWGPPPVFLAVDLVAGIEVGEVKPVAGEELVRTVVDRDAGPTG